MKKIIFPTILAVLLILIPVSCSSPTSPITSPAPSNGQQSPLPGQQTVTVSLIAKNIAFNLNVITVPPGALVTVNFDNEDANMPHNFAVYTDSTAKAKIFVGQTITGPNKIVYTFTAPTELGSYFFRCDIHPSQMTGSFVVE